MIASYPEFMTMRGPQGFTAAINEAAARENLSLSEFARRAILERIERTGVTPPAVKHTVKREG
ncbi:hypothetical protein [Xanthobacter versatilis]|uniref:hypothetical protein n=1 Tax=Xanthobacter autotrophicus (strain ATCC BAA-1158 / Py2) TaxID=78245 RepID=UPI0037273FC5